MKQIKFFLLLTILLCSISSFSQNKTSNDLFFSTIDSIIAKQLKFQKENRNTETVVFLKDSMVNYYYDDAIMPCENQPSKSYYTYDEFGNMTVLIVKNTPDEGCDAIKYKTLFTYENYNLIGRLYQNYDFDLNEWMNSSKRTYQYDANDNVIEELRLHWNPTTSTWDNNTKLTYLYDANLEIERKRYSWDSNINDWFWTLHETNSYDSNNNLLVYIYNSWDYGNNVWETVNKKTYVYDANSNLIEFIDYIKYTSEEVYEWSAIRKNSYSYDADNLLIDRLYYTNWSNVLEDWEKIYKYSYTNDGVGNPLQIQNYLWDFTSENWVNFVLEFYTYNANNNQIEKLVQYWNTTSNVWENSSLTVNTYNEFNRITSRLGQYWYENSWYLDSETTYEYDEFQNLIHMEGYNMYDYWNNFFYYSEYDVALGVNDAEFPEQYIITPNPSNDYISIEGIDLDQNSRIIIYSISAKEILETNSKKRIDISNLENGLYFIKIISDDSIVTKKLLKK